MVMGQFRAAYNSRRQRDCPFDNVAAGEATVKVRANGLTRTIDSDVEIPSERKTAGFAKDIKVAGDVATLKNAPRENGAQTGENQPAPASSGGNYLLQSIAGLIFLVVVVAVVWVLLKSKGVTAENALKKMGVALPGEQGQENDAAAPQAPAVDPNVCEFCGQRKDANGNCGCTLAGGPSPFAGPSHASSAGDPADRDRRNLFGANLRDNRLFRNHRSRLQHNHLAGKRHHGIATSRDNHRHRRRVHHSRRRQLERHLRQRREDFRRAKAHTGR